MPLEKQHKQKTIGEYRRHDKDSGSPEVQIAILTRHIEELTGHLQRHPKDHASRHGLLFKVSRRNRLMNYLHRVDLAKYNELTGRLGLRK